jgi:outer membrane immunogenic protein
MKRMLLAGLAFTTMVAAGPVSAADLPVRRSPAMPTLMNWTGCYVGIAGGEGKAFDTGLAGGRVLNGLLPLGVPVPGGPPLLISYGGFAGGQVGCNYQFTAVIVGIEGEGFWADFGRETVLGGSTSSPKNRSFYDVAVRFGFVILDRTLLYGRMGAIWSQQSYDLTAQLPGAVLTATGSWTSPGVTAGVGVEYALTNYWIARLEMDLIYTMSTTTLATTLVAAPPFGVFTGPSSQTMMGGKILTKLGLSYKF